MPRRLLCMLLLSFSLSAGAAPLHIAVASNFLAPAKALAERYQTETGQSVTVSAGSTGKLYAQIINGAPYDLFFAANAREPERLEQQGLIVAGSRFTYALGQLALWSRDADLLSGVGAHWLRQGNYRRLSLANPKIAPYGEAAMAVLQKIGVADVVRTRLVQGENVGQAYQFIISGNVDAGFVALSQIKSQGGGSYWLPPADDYPPIRQQVVWLARAVDQPVAGAFLDWLRTPEIGALIHDFGYQTEVSHDG